MGDPRDIRNEISGEVHGSAFQAAMIGAVYLSGESDTPAHAAQRARVFAELERRLEAERQVEEAHAREREATSAAIQRGQRAARLLLAWAGVWFLLAAATAGLFNKLHDQVDSSLGMIPMTFFLVSLLCLLLASLEAQGAKERASKPKSY
ncbi:hypothetical protein P2Q00_42820 [Streptomyces coacervatus]|nr:hypothetical protein [Streptomyces coacervatus]MDF2272099.1 hypothetical protein [Streptomyces coacervatus]